MATAAPVGGRLEPAPVKPVTNPGDRWRLTLLVVVAAGVHGLVVARTAMTARDGVGFARTALQLVEPSALRPDATLFDVLRQPGHPPGYPAALLAVSAVVSAPTTQDRMLLAGQLVSALSGVLLVFPLYWLGRTLFNQAVGLAGGLLFTGLPVAARYTSDAVTEGLYLLLLTTALLLGTRAVRKPTVGGFLLCGLATGCGYLVRPEGALAAAAVGLVVLGLTVAGRWATGAAAGRLLALTVGFLLAAGPYMAVIGGLTNKPSVSGILGGFNARDLTKPQAAVPPSPALFAASSLGDGKLPAALLELLQEGTKAFHYGPPLFVAVGLWLAAGRRRADPWLLVPLAFVGLMLPVLLALCLREGYLSERHTLAVVLVLCPFAAAGAEWFANRVGVWWLGWALLAVVLGTCVPGLLKPLHKDRLGHRAAGEYLATHAAPDDILLDPFDWAGFYSGRTLKSIPPDPPAVPGRNSRWAVVEPDEKGLSTLPRLQATWNVMNDRDNPPTVELEWANPDKPGRVKVRLYKQAVR